MPWLLKAEPESRIVKGKDVKYTIDDLQKERVGSWDGVRNNEAKKYLSSMKAGDMAFFYRSNCSQPGIVGIMRIAKEAHPDITAADPSEPYYDPKNPEGKWVAVDVEYVSHIDPPILLSSIKSEKRLENMFLVKRSRLSVSPVSDKEWGIIMQMHSQDQKKERGPISGRTILSKDKRSDSSIGNTRKRLKNGSKDDAETHSSDEKGNVEVGRPRRKLRVRKADN